MLDQNLLNSTIGEIKSIAVGAYAAAYFPGRNKDFSASQVNLFACFHLAKGHFGQFTTYINHMSRIQSTGQRAKIMNRK